MNSYCHGCGVLLQSSDDNKIGYIKEIKEDTKQLCYRCYRLKYHNENNLINVNSDYFISLIKNNVKKSNLVLLIIDLFDISSSLNDVLFSLIKDNDIVVVANKRDLLLKSLKDKKIISYLKREFGNYNLNILDYLITSSSKKYQIDDLLLLINKYYRNKDVYVIGLSNVGKSSIINALLQSQNIKDDLIIVSNYLNTTLDMIKIPIDDKHYLIDMPGIINDKHFVNYLNKNDLKYLKTSKEIKNRIYQLNDKQSIIIGGLVVVNYLQGERCSFNFFFNNNIDLHRAKLENIEKLYDNHLEDNLFKPRAINVNNYHDFIKHDIVLDNSNLKKDIIIMGLGWISLKANNQVIELLLPKNVVYVIKDALI